MNRLKQFKGSMLVYAIYLAVLAYFVMIIPESAQIPTHWNFQGEIDDYSGKWPAILFGVIFNLAMLIFLMFFSFIQPKYKKSEERYEKILPSISLVLVSFFALIHLYTLFLGAFGVIERNFSFLMLLMGFLFILIGNLLPKAPRNYFIGIKTPWTFASEEVWYKTHRLGGKMFMLSGLLFIAKSVFLDQLVYQSVLGASAIVLLLYPLLYSFILYKKLQRKNDNL
jgi:uncharacterized membrane protein